MNDDAKTKVMAILVGLIAVVIAIPVALISSCTG